MKDTVMQIGINGSMLDEHPTGVGIYSVNMINHLSSLYLKENGAKITVFSPTNTLLNSNINIIRLSGLLKSSQYGKIAAFTRFIWNTFYYPFQAGKFNLLISTTTHGSFHLKNQVITIHDLLSLRFNNISPHQRFYFKFLLPYLVSRAKLIIAVSETTKKDIVKFLKCPENKVKVIYNGYDEILYNTNHKEQNKIYKEYGFRNYFLAIGPTYPHKNFELLIDAYNDLDEEIKKQYPLVIAGGKEKYVRGLKKYVGEGSNKEHIHFIGYVPISLMPSLYKESYALVFPSLFEGFGFPLVEAMASGCPVVASDISSIPEVCGDAVLYFDPYNKRSLTIQLERIIADKILYDDLRERGLIRAKNFSWPKAVQELKKIIDETIH
jgi:glycosyltransferase involved in cell wall biosynthesis